MQGSRQRLGPAARVLRGSALPYVREVMPAMEAILDLPGYARTFLTT